MGGVGDWISEQFGSKNKFESKALEPGTGYDFASEKEIAAMQARKGEQIDQTASNQMAQLGLDARNSGLEVAGAMRDRALGRGQSIAQMQADRQMQQATAAQAAQAASARGGAGLALAQQNAANNMANAQGAISNQAQINAAQERIAAESAAMGAFGQLRAGDLASQQQAAQQALSQAQLNQQQRAQNDQMFIASRAGNQQGSMAWDQQRANNQYNADRINAGVAEQNANMAQINAQGLVKGIADGAKVAGKLALGVPPTQLAKGGPVTTGTPYIVGERGPELIVPREPGTVIPAEQTREIMSSSLARMSGPAMRTPLAPNEDPAEARTLSDEELQARARAILEGFRAGMGER